MIVPCETATKSVVPALRALIAARLTDRFEMDQSDVAEVLGISQSAVSKYKRGTRGTAIEIDTALVKSQIERIADIVAEGSYDKDVLAKLFCDACTTIRKSGAMCPLCRRTDTNQKNRVCRTCLI